MGLIARLLYGGGRHLFGWLTMRVNALDFTRDDITLRRAKGGKDCMSMLTERARAALEVQRTGVAQLHARDLDGGAGRVTLSTAFDRRSLCRATEVASQGEFPVARHYRDGLTEQLCRHHVHESRVGIMGVHHVHEGVVRRAMRWAVRESGVGNRATCHTLRHSFATYLLEAGDDFQTLQEVLGHTDVSSTMVYTHVLNRGRWSAESDGPVG